MKAASRFVVACAVGVAASASAAYAVSPMSNGVGDGEANVPFASSTVGAPQDPRALDHRRHVAGTGAAQGDRGSEYVTHDELEQRANELIRRIDRAKSARPPAPTFTDEG